MPPDLETPGADSVPCPGRDAWREFLLGRLSDEEIDRLDRHLQACDACRKTADEVSGEDLDDGLGAPLLEPPPDDHGARGIDFVELLREALERERSEVEAERVERATNGVVGRFVLRERIGDGGFGIVWRARDPKTRRDVAIKIPKGYDRLDSDDLRRFDHEVRAAARLSHPNIVPVLDADPAAGVPHLVMELCKGPTLARWLKDLDGPPPVPLAVGIVAALAGATAAAHAGGVLHRDVKPGNVLLFPVAGDLSDFPFTPRLADFGLAKLGFGGEGADPVSAVPTQSGAWRGTPSYMAPEQVSKAAGECDARTDVWGLGALLYELLAGRAPFQGVNSFEIMKQIQNDAPIPPSALRRGVPRDLETICLKCLEKNQDRRYASAAALRDDLERSARGEPILARPPGPLRRAAGHARRRPVRATLVVAAVLGAAALGWMQIRYNRDMRATLDLLRSRDSVLSRRLYAAEIAQAWRSVQAGRVREARERLDRLAPDPADPSAEDPRGFEWRYLKARTERNPEIRRIEAHKGLVSSVVFSPDRRLMATGGAEDNLVKLWSADTYEPIAVLTGHTGDVNRVAFSPDGTLLASASDDKTVRLWDVAKGETRRVLDCGERMFNISFSPDGEILATSGRTKAVSLWDVATGGLLKRFEVDKGVSPVVGFAPVGRRLLAGDGSHQCKIYEISRYGEFQGAPPIRIGIAGAIGYRIAVHSFSPDGRTLAIGGDGGVMAIVDAETGKIRRLLEPRRQKINCMARLSDGSIVAGDDGGELRVWTDDGASVVVARVPDERASALAVAPDGSVASAGESGTVRIFRPSRFVDRTVVLDNSVPRASIALSGSVAKSWIARRDTESAFRLLDVRAGRNPPSARVRADKLVLVSPDGKWCAVGRHGGSIEIWDIEDRKVVNRLEPTGPCEWRPSPAFSPDGEWILTVENGAPRRFALQVIEWRTNHMVATLPHAKPIYAAAFSPDGRTIVTGNGGSSRNAFLWDSATWAPRVELKGHRREVKAAVFSPDGRIVATGSCDGTIKLWNVADGAPLATLHQESVWIRSLAYSPDGKTLVSGNEAGTVTFWQVSTGQELFRVTDEHANGVLNLLFVEGGRRLVSAASLPGSVAELVVWDADTD